MHCTGTEGSSGTILRDCSRTISSAGPGRMVFLTDVFHLSITVRPMLVPGQLTNLSSRDIFTCTALHSLTRNKRSKGEPPLTSNVERQQTPRIQSMVSFRCQFSLSVLSLVQVHCSVSYRRVVICRLCCSPHQFLLLLPPRLPIVQSGPRGTKG